jgi:hypothetical protein
MFLYGTPLFSGGCFQVKAKRQCEYVRSVAVPRNQPNALRNRVSCILARCSVCMTAGRAAATIVPYFTAWAYPRDGIDLVLVSFCGLLLFQALAVFLIGIRTENRPLEELAQEETPLGIAGAKAVKA